MRYNCALQPAIVLAACWHPVELRTQADIRQDSELGSPRQVRRPQTAPSERPRPQKAPSERLRPQKASSDRAAVPQRGPKICRRCQLHGGTQQTPHRLCEQPKAKCLIWHWPQACPTAIGPGESAFVLALGILNNTSFIMTRTCARCS